MRIAAAALIVAAVAAAFGLVETRFEARKYQAELARMQGDNTQLRQDRSRLLIELSTLGDPEAVYQAGVARLQMRHPALADRTLIYLRD